MRPEIAMSKIIVAEMQTVEDYNKIVEECECPQCKRLIEDIILEEIVHMGEALGQLKRINPEWAKKIAEGEMEGVSVAKGIEPMLPDM